MRLKDTVAIVTGGGGGLGAGIAACLAEAGASIVVSDMNLVNADKVAGAIRDLGYAARASQADVRSADDCRNMVEETLTIEGRIDTVVCNAGSTVYRPRTRRPRR